MDDYSPVIRGLLNSLLDVTHQLHPNWPEDKPEEQTFGRLLDRRESLVRRLAKEPNLTQADMMAKLTTLCARLRIELDINNNVAVTTYLLAESVRDGVVEMR